MSVFTSCDLVLASRLLIRVRIKLVQKNYTTMKKQCLILALVAVTSLVRATTTTVFNPMTVNNSSYNCNLTSTLTGVSGQQVTSCTFNFNNCSLTSFGGGLLYCSLGGSNIGTLTQTASSWTCNLTSTGLTTLNNCIAAGSTCSFGITCTGGWNIGGCTANYTCTPPVTHTTPDAASTASLLSLGLAAAAMLRRKLA